jgi:hypothetical protein
MDHQILIKNKFVSESDCKEIINFIESNINLFSTGPKRLLFTLPFGKDGYHNESRFDLKLVDPIKDLVYKYFDLVIAHVKETYNDNSELYVNSFWLAKQKAGGIIPIHGDNDQGNNKQFKYSCGTYLKTMTLDGTLDFEKLGYIYSPVEGDLVTWASQDPIYDHVVNKVSEDRYSMLFWLTEDPEFNILSS